MDRRSAVGIFVAAGAGSLCGRLPASGSRAVPPEDDPGTFTLRSDVRLVLLDVSVKDRRGGFVPGLPKENFNVFENGRLQTIKVFERGDLPVTAGILVDESRSMSPKRTDVLIAAQTFIEESNPKDEMFVLNFNDTVTPGLPGNTPFSGDRQQLRAALYRGLPQGKTALNDAVAAGLKHLQLGRYGRKALLVISDGGDNASQSTRRETLGMVQMSTATIYAIGLFEPDDPDRDPGILRQFADITGGEAYFPASTPDLSALCRNIANDIRRRYIIGYLPAAGNESRRRIHVAVSAPAYGKLNAHTRTSYRYDEVEQQNVR
jgi:Ca-activated chloride channel family protein